MKYIVDENTSVHIVHLMQQLGAEVVHVTEEFRPGIPDQEFLPEIVERELILITTDEKMKSATGKHGHRAILEAYKVQVLFLPTQFKSWRAWDRAVYMLRYFEKIDAQASKMRNLRLARLTDNGKIEPI